MKLIDIAELVLQVLPMLLFDRGESPYAIPSSSVSERWLLSLRLTFRVARQTFLRDRIGEKGRPVRPFLNYE